jgi:hypothetical protein
MFLCCFAGFLLKTPEKTPFDTGMPEDETGEGFDLVKKEVLGMKEAAFLRVVVGGPSTVKGLEEVDDEDGLLLLSVPPEEEEGRSDPVDIFFPF